MSAEDEAGDKEESRGIDRLKDNAAAAADGAALEEEDGAGVAIRKVVRSLELRKAAAAIFASSYL